MADSKELTLDDLTRILRRTAGAGERGDLDGNVLDIEFSELGYDSVALLEMCGAVEREYSIKFDDYVVESAKTPRAFLAVVNDSLAQSI